MSSEIPEMYCVRSAQQWSPKQAQRARACAPPLSSPSFTFRLPPPHFRISHLYSAGVRCGKRPHYIIAWHFVDVLDPCLRISDRLIPRSRDCTSKTGSTHETLSVHVVRLEHTCDENETGCIIAPECEWTPKGPNHIRWRAT